MIILKSVCKEIKNKKVLSDVSITFEKGKIYLLKGHNGCGKTMLLRLLCDLIHATSGIVEKQEYTYGVIIETPTFIEHETGRANLKILAAIKKEIDMKEIESWLEKVNLLEVADAKVNKYSLGMKQRLAFCQAIMENPDVLLLDEPFNALDDINYNAVVKYLKEVKKDKIIVIAAHGINSLETSLFDEIISMNEGRITDIERME